MRTCIFNMAVNFTYSPPMTTDNGYYRTIFSDLFASDVMYEACSETIETIAILSKRLNSI